MPIELDQTLRRHGTRFRLFHQSPVLTDYREPETVWVSPRPGSIAPGPADDRMYVVDPLDKPVPYEYPALPPYRGIAHQPVEAGPDGHFDHLAHDSRAFQAAHMYGALRRVLDIWESYFRGPIPWHFEADYPRLELIPWIPWDNAQSGYGFIETGYGEDDQGLVHPYCLNFDVLAHELGHSIIFSTVGVPTGLSITSEYRGFQESCADVIALISVLHFDRFVDSLLACCNGNLYTENELNRIGELSDTDQIRIASNAFRMSDVADVDTPADQLSQPELHRLGEPLTGALFDLLIAVYQDNLVDDGLIDDELAQMSRAVTEPGALSGLVATRFEEAYRGAESGFESALLRARDYIGYCLAAAWRELDADYLGFGAVEQCFLDADRLLGGGRHQQDILDLFGWRGIRPGIHPDRVRQTPAPHPFARVRGAPTRADRSTRWLRTS